MATPQKLGHLFHVEKAVLDMPGFNASDFTAISPVHNNTRRSEINPALYAHVYHLLGSNPSRFTSDLTLYIATVRAFFDRQEESDLIQIPNGINADAKKRISEDMGVALACTFMTAAFDISWESISQIPANSKLASKRPDFQSYCRSDSSKPYIFEAKGTTVLASVEKATTKALEQVKRYPVSAHSKFVLTSYLSADSRYFPSTTFVIDPPAPSADYIDPGISTLLHFEKTLQFSGLIKTSVHYIRLLSKLLKDGESRISSINEMPWRQQGELRALRELYDEESQELQPLSAANRDFIGQRIEADNATIFFGADKDRIEKGLSFAPSEEEYEQNQIVGDSSLRSLLDDGSIFDMQISQLS